MSPIQCSSSRTTRHLNKVPFLTLSVNFGFHGPPSLMFKTDRLDLRGLDLRKKDVIYSLAQCLTLTLARLRGQVKHICGQVKQLKDLPDWAIRNDLICNEESD